MYKADWVEPGYIILSRWIVPPGISTPEPDYQAGEWVEFLRFITVKTTEFGLEYKRHDGSWYLLWIGDSLQEVVRQFLTNEYGLF